MTGMSVVEPEIDVDLRVLFLSIVRNWRRIVLVALAVTAAAFAYTMLASPKYKSEARLLIETRESVYTRSNTGPDADRSLLDEEGVTSQVQVITASELLKDVADKLKLAGRSEFDPAADISLPSRLLIMVGLLNDPSEMPPEERVLAALREKLNVYRVEKSRVIVIEASSKDPQLAAAIPNAIADAYIAVNTAAKLEVNNTATAWLEPEIADLRNKVRDAERKVAEYRSSSDLLTGQNNTTLAAQQLSDFSTELSRVKAARSTAEARAAAIRDALKNGAALDTMPEVLSSALIQRLRERQVQLKADIADLSTTLLDGHPKIKALRSQLADLDRQIRVEAEKVMSGLVNEAVAAKFRETELTADLNRIKAESARAGGEEVELRALEREANAQRELLESYLTRYREATARNERNYLPADARVFSRADVPSEPYAPKKIPIIGAAFVGSLLLMAILTLVGELFSGRAMREKARFTVDPVPQVEMPEPAGPMLGAALGKTEKAAPEGPEAFGGVTAAAAAEQMIASGTTRAVFVSPEGDDAAASAVVAARAAADTGLRVILLDLTATGAASRPMTEGARLAGVTDLLCSEASFAEVIHTDLYSDCHVMPTGTANAARAMRAVDRLPMILDALSAAYELVVIECGASDASALDRLTDEGTDILLSVLDPADPDVIATAEDLASAGLDVILVAPAATRPAKGKVRSVA
jgi:uncharacterized protein involved in exopolysaccharide biosynthesis/Mrp family chromosome partitioning ATPase